MAKYIFDTDFAQKTVRKYCCSACWGHLIQRHEDDQTLVECHACGPDTKGFVTKHYAERRLEESRGEVLETRAMLRDLGIIKNPHAGKSTSDLLKEIGF